MAAGSGFTAAADASLVNTITGITTGAYPIPSGLWCALYTNNFTAAAKSPTTGVEWLTSSDTAYARQSMGASPTASWTITAYASSTGVVFKNTNTITQPGVAGTAQTLGALGFCDTVGPTGGNVDFFIDLATAQPVGLTVQVILAAASPGPAGVTFTLY
jgi:hypothetical protein